MSIIRKRDSLKKLNIKLEVDQELEELLKDYSKYSGENINWICSEAIRLLVTKWDRDFVRSQKKPSGRPKEV